MHYRDARASWDIHLERSRARRDRSATEHLQESFHRDATDANFVGRWPYLFSFATSAASLSSWLAWSRSSFAFWAWPPRSNSLAFCAAEILSNACTTNLCAAAMFGCFLALTFCTGSFARAAPPRSAPQMTIDHNHF